MDFVHRLPFMLSAAATIIVGLVSSGRTDGNQNIYLRMAVCMVVFYILGLYLRTVLLSVNDEVKERLEKEEELKLQQERENSDSRPQPEGNEGES